MKKWIWICIAAALVIGLFAGVKAYRYWYDHKSPNFEGTLDVYVYPWMEPETVCDSIIASVPPGFNSSKLLENAILSGIHWIVAAE